MRADVDALSRVGTATDDQLHALSSGVAERRDFLRRQLTDAQQVLAQGISSVLRQRAIVFIVTAQIGVHLDHDGCITAQHERAAHPLKLWGAGPIDHGAAVESRVKREWCR